MSRLMNSMFMSILRAEGRTSHTDYLLDAEKVWSDLVVKLYSYLPSTDVMSADRLEMKNEVINSWSSEVRILLLTS